MQIFMSGEIWNFCMQPVQEQSISSWVTSFSDDGSYEYVVDVILSSFEYFQGTVEINEKENKRSLLCTNRKYKQKMISL